MAHCVDNAKEKTGNIKNCLVVPYLSKKFNRECFDEIIYPPLENVPYRYAILRRNEWLANNADIIISHVIHTMGGAEKMLKYAERKNKKIIYLNKLINK